jgi:hypothetical protein
MGVPDLSRDALTNFATIWRLFTNFGRVALDFLRKCDNMESGGEERDTGTRAIGVIAFLQNDGLILFTGVYRGLRIAKRAAAHQGG